MTVSDDGPFGVDAVRILHWLDGTRPKSRHGQGPSPSPTDIPATSPEGELKSLKQQAAVLRQQMEGGLKKIIKLENGKPGIRNNSMCLGHS